MPTCTCRRCHETTDCLTVLFTEQHGWEADTTMMLCDDCYDMYRQLYNTRVVDDEEDTLDDCEEIEEDPVVPFICVDEIEEEIEEDPVAPFICVDEIDGDPNYDCRTLSVFKRTMAF